jgi:acid phosphatase
MNRRDFLIAAFAGVPLSIGALGHLLDAGELAFLVVGDWGTGGALQRRIAASMAAVAARSGASFVISTGDNIYPDGVESDVDPQWKTKFEKIYTDLPLPWWSVLGNHDHRGNPDAQIAYGRRNPRWNMPGRTWRKDVTQNGGSLLSVLGLDTTPIMQGAEGWKNQLAWLDETLTASPATVSVVVGHHPLRSYGHYGDSQPLVKHVKPILDKHHVRMYICGHDHDMQLIRNPSDGFACLVSGGGGGERPTRLGVHSKIAYTDGGFACVRMHSSELSIELFDSHGVSKGSFNL